MKAAMERAGFTVTRVIWHEHGKTGMPWTKWAYYHATGLLSHARLRIAPGMIFIGKPR
jgi:hypothetical protein